MCSGESSARCCGTRGVRRRGGEHPGRVPARPAASARRPSHLAPCLSADFDRAEVRQPEAEGRERSPHSCHQQALQIGSLSGGGTERGAYTSCQPHHRALPPSLPPVTYSKRSAMGSTSHTCLALPVAVLSLPALISPTTHTPAILLFLI